MMSGAALSKNDVRGQKGAIPERVELIKPSRFSFPLRPLRPFLRCTCRIEALNDTRIGRLPYPRLYLASDAR